MEMEAVQAFFYRKKSTVRNLQKFAPVCELKQFFLLETYSEIRKYDLVPLLYEKNHSLKMQMQKLYEHLPRKHLGHTFYGLYLY